MPNCTNVFCISVIDIHERTCVMCTNTFVNRDLIRLTAEANLNFRDIEAGTHTKIRANYK